MGPRARSVWAPSCLAPGLLEPGPGPANPPKESGAFDLWPLPTCPPHEKGGDDLLPTGVGGHLVCSPMPHGLS